MQQQGLVRIIAGKWRGRWLKVLDLETLRPTPDRVRETLFNWLVPVIEGASCLDLFAGSGALGFEAASRGAHHVVMVDQSRAVVELLQEECAILGANNIDIYRATVPAQLRKTGCPFDIVFLDPPYNADLLLPCCRYLEKHEFLAEGAYLYLESQRVIAETELPEGWQMIKCQQAGKVSYQLVQRIFID